jgi:hypothetical protein
VNTHIDWTALVEALIAFLTALTALISWLNNQHLKKLSERNERIDKEKDGTP